MKQMKKLRDLARDDRIIDLQEKFNGVVQALWSRMKAAGFTDDEVQVGLNDLARNEYRRRRAGITGGENVVDIRRKRRKNGDITLPLIRADQYLLK